MTSTYTPIFTKWHNITRQLLFCGINYNYFIFNLVDYKFWRKIENDNLIRKVPRANLPKNEIDYNNDDDDDEKILSLNANLLICYFVLWILLNIIEFIHMNQYKRYELSFKPLMWMSLKLSSFSNNMSYLKLSKKRI